MTGDHPYPLDRPRPAVDIKRLLESHGVCFDGDLWLLMEEMVHPYQEVFLVAAVERETVLRSANTIDLRLELVETPHGCVVRVSVAFQDHRVAPTRVDTFLNPDAAEIRGWLRSLASQSHMNLLHMDCHTGEEIKLARHHIAPEIPDAARRILDATLEDVAPDLGRWVAAVEYCKEHLDPPPGHVRRPSSLPKVERDDPCP